MKEVCKGCAFADRGYCVHPDVYLIDRGSIADFGMVSCDNFAFTTCATYVNGRLTAEFYKEKTGW